ncbi:MAG: sugar phosphate isomerase/epimerase family protein [Thermodesulfovibrionales bacterium]
MTDPHVHIPYEKIKDYFNFIKNHKINLEIYFSANVLDFLKDSDVIKLKERLDYNPSLSIHGPFMDLSPGALDSKVRAITLERFLNVFDISRILKPSIIVFHSGYEKWRYSHRIDKWLEASLITWEYLLPRAKEKGIKIAIENVFEDEPTNLRVLMEKIGSQSFGICFDTGHFNLFSKIPLEEWLNQLKPYIIELHLHDNNKNYDEHKAINDGTFDFDKLFSALKGENILYTLEAHTPEDVLKSLESLEYYNLST